MLPARSVVWRCSTATCLAWGNRTPAGAGAVWIVRCSMRPWPRSTVWCAGGKGVGGQAVDRGLQAGLVALDRQQVVGVLVLDEPAGMRNLGVERVGGHHLACKVQWLQQRAEPADLIGLGVHLSLREHGP